MAFSTQATGVTITLHGTPTKALLFCEGQVQLHITTQHGLISVPLYAVAEVMPEAWKA